MALGRKGARRTVVDGTAHRRRLCRRPTRLLVVTTNQPHLGNRPGALGAPVLPSDASDAVASALRAGREPTRGDSPFHLDRSAGFSPLP
ncbi:hypothetical protein [Streptomyces abyssomicinicus]|uniref:hypothetical protein n=1 Tax=Streptomyces abyssomicinicus TaxID=574929 RepID=UPI0012505A84|nr:hypothetical protein [Streptomyces abyssomicinicus]